ncbi:NADH dehydrogenase [ubiquinone] 1 alpha subcomplex assembly factor 7 [Kaistia soli DSM 19436]|uniref:NADH dehydrogenase [ubiquinone] 1 alpha subcomplex assembly factor 7 n=1 Tax=Kaistia soli DSM 19436 TaxID=1122133 RepID=A0A1M4Z9E3_9HYPH|nr:SAM-dependent methyltransferase [Kaistia soli]SHF14641.1 NADH dehydrogenase [ubiquinone] 1 alpha subcomplex assembly factor 7 [Kaistia soli DSM 19436]
MSAAATPSGPEPFVTLEQRLIARILATGPITIADYMATCLGDPEHGYYMRRDPFGAAGDFVTAPEISQMFGELIGLWAVETWRRMGRPASFVLGEFGPGRGTLMADALRAARLAPDFLVAARIVLVETSPHLREMQRTRLAGHDVTFAARAEDLPDGPAIVIANEFFDALPIRQFVRIGDGYAERMVGVVDEKLAFGLRPGAAIEGLPSHPPEGAVVEIAGPATAVMTTLAARITAMGGAVLAIDYGHDGGFGDTLQAMRRHAFVAPLDEPGAADLTAHVDFAALAASARAAGASVFPLMMQGDFLLRLGLVERAGRLGAGKDAAAQEAIRVAAERLAGPEAMGTLFKVLVVARDGLVPPF